ncbi:MAG: hypothetical protein NTV34_17590, partial [Proteobacteria bacterium]|nr:hypothetical protein [Pseudomonadota bacterium]
MLGITKTKKTKVMATSLAESVAGKSFIERARRDAWTLNARSGLWALLIFDLVSFIGHLIVYPYGMPGALLLFHAVALGWGILVWKTKFGAIWNFFVWPIFSCFSIACHLEAVRLDILQYDELVLENASVLISIVFISTMLMPGPVRNSLATGVFAVVASYFATRGYTMQAAYCVLVLLTSIGGVAWNAASVHIVEEMASSSLFMRATMAPAHVAEHTIDHLGAASGFPVAERHTSVVVIKWSEIAARSHDMLPAALNVLLTSYFSIVDQILINQLPRGTWFADVIQHEIHV